MEAATRSRRTGRKSGLASEQLERALIDAPRWLLLALLVWAPLAYGSTRDSTLTVMNWALSAIVLLWLAGILCRRSWPAFRPVLAVCSLFLIAQGWFMIAKAQYRYDRATFEFVPIACFWRGGPGALDTVEAWPVMLRATGLLLLVCFVCDLARRRVWRIRICWTIAGTAAVMMLLGLTWEFTGDRLHGIDPEEPGSPFSMYLYHANAAAFINLVLPIVAGLALLAFGRRGTQLGRSVWPAVWLLCLAGAAVAASKAGMVITVLLIVAIAIWASTQRNSRAALGKRKTVFVGIAALLLTICAVVAGWHQAQGQLLRLPTIFDDGTLEGRVLAYRAGWTMMPDAGLWGIGPGNFGIAFPHYTNFLGEQIAGIWDFLHEDYLQTAIEMGWIGAAVAMLILFGGMIAGARTLSLRQDELSREDRTLLFMAAIALAGIAAHATVDFPLQIASLQLYAASFLGMVWGARDWASSRSGRERLDEAERV